MRMNGGHLMNGFFMNDLGSRIKKMRKQKNITQKEFSERIYVTQSYVSRLESNKERPTDMLLKLISLEFGISLAWLKDGEGEMEVSKDAYDYFDRNHFPEMKDMYLESIQRLDIEVHDLKKSDAYLNLSAIIDDFATYIREAKKNPTLCELGLEQLASINLAVFEYIKDVDCDISSERLFRSLNQTLGRIHDAVTELNILHIHFDSKKNSSAE